MSGKHFHDHVIIRKLRRASSRLLAVMMTFALVCTMIPFMPLLASGEPSAVGDATDVVNKPGIDTSIPGIGGGNPIDPPADTGTTPDAGNAGSELPGSETPSTETPGTDLPGNTVPGDTVGGGGTVGGTDNGNPKPSEYTLRFTAGNHGSLRSIPGSLLEIKVSAGILWSSIAVPAPLADKGYKFIGWEPALPTGDTVIDKDYSFSAKFVDTKTAKAMRQNGDIQDLEPDQGALDPNEATAGLVQADGGQQGFIPVAIGDPFQYTVQYWLVTDGVEAYHSSNTFVGFAGDIVMANPGQFSYPGYSYYPDHYSSYPSGIVPEDNSLALRLYYYANVAVSFDLGDGDWTWSGSSVPSVYPYLSTIQLPGNVSGDFIGWMAGADGPVLSAYSNYTVTKPVTFYAQYSSKGDTAAISVAPGVEGAYYGSSAVEGGFQLGLTVDRNEAGQAQMPGEVFTHPERALVGWSTTPGKEAVEAGDAAVGGVIAVTKGEGGVAQAWYGIWTPLSTYKVSYLPGSHGAFAPVDHYVPAGDPTPLPPAGYDVADATDPSWHFVGWAPLWADTVSGNAVYEAQWSRDYFILFNVGDAPYPVAPVSLSDLDFADPLASSIGGLPQPSSPDGYEFEGWLTEPDAEAPVDDSNSYADIVGGDAGTYEYTLYADFKPLSLKTFLSKEWNDESNRYKNRPTSIDIELIDNTNLYGGNFTITDDGDGDDIWICDPQAYIEETGGDIVEHTVPEGYTVSYRTEYGYWGGSGDYTRIAINTLETTTVTISVVWDDTVNGTVNGYGNWPSSVEVNLYANGNGVTIPAGNSPYTIIDDGDGDNVWTFVVPDALPTHVNMEDAVYTVSETVLPNGYQVTGSGSISDTEPSITYSTVTQPVTLSKVWADDNNAHGDRPASVSLELRANGTTFAGSYSLSDNGLGGPWTRTEQQPTHRNKQPAVYTAVETNIPTDYTPTASGLTVTNARTLKVLFNGNASDAVLSTASKTVSFGNPYGQLPPATRPGYSFSGWYTAPEGGSQVTASTIVNTVYDHTLYARWTANGNTPYIVIHWLIAPDESRIQAAVVSFTGATGTVATAPGRTFTGYVLSPGYPDTVSSGIITGDGGLVLHLYYVAVQPPPPPPPPPPPVVVVVPPVEQPVATTPLPPPTTPTVPAPPRPTQPDTTAPDPTPPITPTPPPKPIPEPEGSWALLNLILSILGVLLAVVAVLRFALTRREENVDQNGRTTVSDRPHPRWWILTLAAAVLAFIIFLVTQDMRLPMAWVDWWTIVHAIILIIQLAFFVLALKRVEGDDEGNRQVQGQSSTA